MVEKSYVPFLGEHMSDYNKLGDIPQSVPEEYIQDFRNHLFACFKYLGLGEPTPLQYAMADALQGFNQDMQLQAGRGAGKSVITACLASWFLLRDPNATIMVVSATSNKAAEFMGMVRRIMSLVPYMTHLQPGEADRDNAFALVVGARTKEGQDPSCFAKGITGQLTGSHADYVIGDDVEIQGNSDTATQRQKLLMKIHEFEQIRNVGGRVLLLGTPQTRESIYLQLADAYTITKFPAVMPDKDIVGQAENIAQWIWDLELPSGSPTQPERFPDEVLLERKAKIGPRQFALHYQLDCSLADEAKYPLRLSDLIVLDVSPQVFPEKVVWASADPCRDIPSFGLSGDKCFNPMWISDQYSAYQQTVMTIDPSGRGADETAVIIASTVNGYIIIHELIGLQGGYDPTTLKKIAKIAYDYNINLIRVEDNFGDGMYTQLLRPHVGELCGPVAIEGYRVSGAKEARMISILEPVMAQHRLCFNKKAIKQEETQRQITRLTEYRGALRHDDRVDVLSAAVAYWEDLLGINVDDVIVRRQAIEKDEEMKAWLSDKRRYSHFLGKNISGATRREDPNAEPQMPPKPPGVKMGLGVLKNRQRRQRRFYGS